MKIFLKSPSWPPSPAAVLVALAVFPVVWSEKTTAAEELARIAEVRSLPRERAVLGLPVHVRGVVTWMSGSETVLGPRRFRRNLDAATGRIELGAANPSGRNPLHRNRRFQSIHHFRPSRRYQHAHHRWRGHGGFVRRGHPPLNLPNESREGNHSFVEKITIFSQGSSPRFSVQNVALREPGEVFSGPDRSKARPTTRTPY